MVSGRSKQANIHTHECNEVTLVWGSLRLTPISSTPVQQLHVYTSQSGHSFTVCREKTIVQGFI